MYSNKTTYIHSEHSLQLLPMAFLSKAVTRLEILPPSLQKWDESNKAFTKPGHFMSQAAA